MVTNLKCEIEMSQWKERLKHLNNRDIKDSTRKKHDYLLQSFFKFDRKCYLPLSTA